MLDEIKEAGRHLERSTEESKMRHRVMEMLEGAADPEQRTTLQELANLIMDCHRRHRALHGVLMRAEEEIPNEQLRQRFAPPAAITTLSMSRDILDRMLRLGQPKAMMVVSDFFESLVGPRPAKVMDLFHLFDALMQPRHEYTENELVVLEPEFDAEEQGGFSATAVIAARSILESTRNQPARASELLRQARRSPMERAQVIELVRLSVLWAYAPEQIHHPEQSVVADGMRSVSDGTSLNDPEFAGDDLLVDSRPLVEVAANG